MILEVNMKFTALASGSSGNCFYIENKNTAILVDAGISTKQILLRLASLNLNPEKIKGIFITHEHIDHIRGADVFARKFEVPIFATKKTNDNCFLCSKTDLFRPIKNESKISLGDLKIQTFSKTHHAADPVSYTIQGNKKISVITDSGCTCKNIAEHISEADLLCLEANYDEEMLNSGPYPYFLKKLVGSEIGHLSNKQAGLSVLEHASKKLKKIVLSHLSQTNNTPEVAFNTFNSLIKERKDLTPEIYVSTREVPTQLFNI